MPPAEPDDPVEERCASPGQREPAAVAIVVVSWNTCDVLRDALASVPAAAPGTPVEVVVVDNGSTDGTRQMLAREFPDARVLVNKDNRGFAAANNQGVEQSNAPLVLLLNSDTVLRPGAVDAMVDGLVASPGVAAVGPRLVAPDGTTQRSCSRAPTAARELAHMAHLDERLAGLQYACERWPQDLPRDVDVLQGACLLVRREVYSAVGGLDEGYHMYSEEVELCDRIRGAGWRLQWVPTAVVVHLGGASAALARERTFRSLYAGKVRFFRRNRSRRELVTFKIGLAGLAVPRIGAALVASALRLPNRVQAKQRGWRYARLLRDLPRL